MAEEYKNGPEHETPKIATEESPATTAEVKDRGMFDFLKKKEEVKPQETPLESEFEHKAQISEPTFVAKHEEEEHKEHMNPVLEQIHQKHEEEEQKEHKPSLIEQLHQKHEEEEKNKPNLLQKLHRSNSSSSSSSDEEGADGEKRKKEKKKIFGGEEKTEEEKKGIMDKIKEKLPTHGKKPKDEEIKEPVTIPPPTEHPVVHSRTEEEKKGIMDQIKEKLPAHDKKSEDDKPVVVGEPVTIPPATEHPVIAPSVHSVEHPEEHPAEKKGILEKIKEKLPGYQAKSSGEEEKKEKESE